MFGGAVIGDSDYLEVRCSRHAKLIVPNAL